MARWTKHPGVNTQGAVFPRVACERGGGALDSSTARPLGWSGGARGPVAAAAGGAATFNRAQRRWWAAWRVLYARGLQRAQGGWQQRRGPARRRGQPRHTLFPPVQPRRPAFSHCLDYGLRLSSLLAARMRPSRPTSLLQPSPRSRSTALTDSKGAAQPRRRENGGPRGVDRHQDGEA